MLPHKEIHESDIYLLAKSAFRADACPAQRFALFEIPHPTQNHPLNTNPNPQPPPAQPTQPQHVTNELTDEKSKNSCKI